MQSPRNDRSYVRWGANSRGGRRIGFIENETVPFRGQLRYLPSNFRRAGVRRPRRGFQPVFHESLDKRDRERERERPTWSTVAHGGPRRQQVVPRRFTWTFRISGVSEFINNQCISSSLSLSLHTISTREMGIGINPFAIAFSFGIYLQLR